MIHVIITEQVEPDLKILLLNICFAYEKLILKKKTPTLLRLVCRLLRMNVW